MEKVNEMYELVYIGYDDMYFMVGLFFTIEEAINVIREYDKKGAQLSEDFDESERVEIVRVKTGFGYNLRKTVAEISREDVPTGEDDDYKVVSIKVKVDAPLHNLFDDFPIVIPSPTPSQP